MHGLPLDDGTVDRLVSGRLAPDDAPPGYARVASLLSAARGPFTEAERRVDDEVVRAAAALAACDAASTTQRGRTMRRSFVPVKVAAASAVGALGLATAAAAVGVNLAAHHAHAGSGPASAVLSGSSTGSSGTGSTTDTGSGGTGPGGTGHGGTTQTPVGPVQGMTKGHATFGLCTAFLAARSATGTSPGAMATSVAFKALVNTVGGGTASAAATACTAYVAGHHPGRPGTGTSGTGTSGTGTAGTGTAGKATMPPAVVHPTSTTHPGPANHPTPTSHPGPTSNPTGATHPGTTPHPTASTHPGT